MTKLSRNEWVLQYLGVSKEGMRQKFSSDGFKFQIFLLFNLYTYVFHNDLNGNLQCFQKCLQLKTKKDGKQKV